MKNIALLLLLFATAFFSCGKEKIKGGGNVITESRQEKNFYSVSVYGSTDVYITYSDKYEVEVKAYENIIPSVETSVRNGVLMIKMKGDVRNNNAEVHIKMPTLSGLSTFGSGNMDAKGLFLGMDYFTAEVSGTGNISIERGGAKNYKVSITGSGNVSSFGFIAEQATVSINGSGNAEINVLNSLKATLKGSGNVYYKGSPVITSTTDGSGKVIKK